VYEFPQNRFVADFFGQINAFEATVLASDGEHLSVRLENSDSEIRTRHNQRLEPGTRCTIGVRPEKLLISTEAPSREGHTVTRGVVEDLAYYGNRSLYRVRSQDGHVIQVSAQNYQRSAELLLEWDDEVFLSWDSSCSVVLTQ
jgi:putrescine transport system ATP-binding protein